MAMPGLGAGRSAVNMVRWCLLARSTAAVKASARPGVAAERMGCTGACRPDLPQGAGWCVHSRALTRQLRRRQGLDYNSCTFLPATARTRDGWP